MVMPLPFSVRRPTVPAKDGASWPHVIILGGGFAGAHAVGALRDARVRVTLIDRNVYKTFQPLLYQVATAGLNPGDVTMFLRGLSLKVPNMRYRQGEVEGVDPERKVVKLDEGQKGIHELQYDYLIIANGATTTYFGTPGAEEHAMPMYTRSQSLAIRDRIFSELERSSREDVLGHDKLHVCIVGGGPTGVEIAGALADFRMQELDILYPEMDPGTLQVTVLQRGDELIKEFSPKYREYAAEELRDRGVTLRLGHGVKSVGYDHVVLDNGSILESDITIWAAGVAIPESVKEWGLPQDKRGRIAVDDYLQVKGFPGVYAAGDIAGQDEPLPQLSAARDPDGSGRGPVHRRGRRRQAPQAVHVHRSGHHGHHRPSRRDRRDPPRGRSLRCHGLGRVARRAHHQDDRAPQPARRRDEPAVPVRRHPRHAPAEPRGGRGRLAARGQDLRGAGRAPEVRSGRSGRRPLGRARLRQELGPGTPQEAREEDGEG